MTNNVTSDTHKALLGGGIFKIIFDRSSDPECILRDKHIIDCNDAAIWIMQAEKKSQLLTTDLFSLSPSHQPNGHESSFMMESYMQTASQEGRVQFEWMFKRLDGSELYAEVTLLSVGEDEDPLLHMHLRDLTHQKAIELELNYTQKRFQEIAEIASDWVWEVDETGTYIYVSERVKDFLGYEASEIIGKTPFDLMPPDEAKRVAAFFYNVASEQKPFKDFDNLNLHKDGHEVMLRTSAIPIFDVYENLIGFRGSDKDVTHEQQLISSLSKSRHNLTQAQRVANIGHWEFDVMTGSLYWSDQTFRIFGLEPQIIEPSYETFLSFIHPDDRQRVDEAYHDSLQNGSGYKVTHRIITKQGNQKYVEERCEHECDSAGNIIRSLGTAQDVTEKIESEKSLRLVSTVFTHSTDAVIITDSQNDIVAINHASEKLTGYKEEEVLGKNPKVFSSGHNHEEVYADLWDTISKKGTWKGQIRDKRRNGEEYIAEQSIIAVKNASGEIENYIGITSDITQLVKHQKEKQLALTTSRVGGLKNRNALIDDLEDMPQTYGALIDMKGFHQINDFYGHGVADQLLEAIGGLIQSQCQHTYPIYHLHADSFVITMPSKERPDSFFNNIESLINLLQQTDFTVDDITLSLSFTGVVACGKAETLLRELDMAMKHARHKHLDFWIHDDVSDLTPTFRDNIYWTKALKNAFKEERITVYFQPIYELKSSRIVHYEALVRMIAEDGSVVTPNFFLDAAEQSNQMYRLTETVFLKTLEMLNRCEGAYSFSINISTTDMQNEVFIELIRSSLSDFKIAQKVCFEILETQDMTDLDAMERFVEIVHGLGCSVAIDDFGSGFANYENLIKLDIDIIKIDGSLIEKIATHQDAYDIVDSIVNFANKRRIQTIAEYVRNRAIYDASHKLGIDKVQGYYIDKPKEDIEEHIDNEQINEQEPYKLLIYVSKAKSTITYEDAKEILNISWEKNRRNGIGGVLMYNNLYFIQLLDGPVDKVDRIFERITQDTRHSDIRLLGEKLSNEQEFTEWNMGFLPKSSAITELLISYNIEDEKGLYYAEFDEMKKLLGELTLYL